MLGKGSSPRDGQVLEQAAQGSGRGMELPEFKKCSDNTQTQGLGFG